MTLFRPLDHILMCRFPERLLKPNGSRAVEAYEVLADVYQAADEASVFVTPGHHRPVSVMHKLRCHDSSDIGSDFRQEVAILGFGHPQGLIANTRIAHENRKIQQAVPRNLSVSKAEDTSQAMRIQHRKSSVNCFQQLSAREHVRASCVAPTLPYASELILMILSNPKPADDTYD